MTLLLANSLCVLSFEGRYLQAACQLLLQKENRHLKQFTHPNLWCSFHWIISICPPPPALVSSLCPWKYPVELIYIVSEAVKFLFIDLLRKGASSDNQRGSVQWFWEGSEALGVSERVQRPWLCGDIHSVYLLYWSVWLWRHRYKNPMSLRDQSI